MTSWLLLNAYVFNIKGPQAVIDEESVMHLWNELKRHYWRQRKAKILVQKLEGFTLSMMGSRSHPAMKTKGVETKDLLPFVMEQLKTHRAALPHPQVRHLILAGEALVRVLDKFDESPIRVSILAQQAIHDAAKKYLQQAKLGGVPDKPKNHQFLHMVHSIQFKGNPNFSATFFNEGLNRVLAAIAAGAHRANWEDRCLSLWTKTEAKRKR